MRVRHLFLVCCVFLLGPRPAEATFIYTFDAGGSTGGPASTTPISFSFLHETLGPAHLGGFNWPAINEDCSRGICRSDFLAISLPAHCQISIVMDFRFQVSGRDFPNELELLGTCRDPVTGLFSGLIGMAPQWSEPFDHVGTYFSGGTATRITIAEVPEPATWLLSGLGLALLRLRRARR
jgi:hypothetical protein